MKLTTHMHLMFQMEQGATADLNFTNYVQP